MEDKISFRQVGRDFSGKIYKGNVIDAYNRYTQPSIPTKTEQILQANKKAEAFGVSAPRFSSAKATKLPGPGQYTFAENRTASASAKGLGGFASRVPRFRKFQYNTAAPGPGSYNAQLRRVQSGTLIRAERGVKSKPKPVVTPAPGQYDPCLSTSKSITSIFKSKVDRLEAVKNENPAPWQYTSDQPMNRSKSVSAVFKPPTYKRQNKNLYDPHGDVPVDTGPGPGQYAVEEAKDLTKGSHMFMVGNRDRFGLSQLQHALTCK